MTRMAPIFLVLVGGCALDPLVGADCLDGWIECDGVCVDPTTDETSCGGCGNVCAAGQECVGGVCGGDTGCELPEVWCDAAACADLQTDPANCGACGFVCPEGAACAGGSCVADCGGTPCPACQADETACGSACVELDSDPDNCGGCGMVCDTGLCEDGACRAEAVGHLVLIGHDYARSRRAQARLVANAVMIAQGELAVATYAQDADPTCVANAETAVAQAAGRAGRTVAFSRIEDTERAGDVLAGANVLLVHAQAAATHEALTALGQQWRDLLATFLGRGGVMVVLDAPATSELGGTWRVVAAAELVAITGATDVTGQTVDLVDPGDAVALGMGARYRAEQHSVSFTAPDASPVVAAGGDPVVLHEVFLP